MSQYFSKKTILFLALFSLLAYSESTEPEVFKCSPETLDSLCSAQNPVTVCALDDDNQYLTFKSACEACSHNDTVSYTEGQCKCPHVPCGQNQTCTDGRCLNIETATTRQLVEIARKLLSKEKYADSLPLINKVIEQRPQDSYPLYLAALATFGDTKYQECLKYVKTAITIDPDLPDYYIIRGRAFAELRKHEEAQKQFQKALSMGFNDIGLIAFYQAQNLLLQKKFEESIKKYEQAIVHHPQKTSWYLRKALAHSINKQERMAVISCQEGLKIDPNNEEILSFMKQFKIMDQDRQQDLEEMQQRNLKASNNSKGMDPEAINKFIEQKQEQERFEFDRQRLEEKKKKQQQEQRKKQQEQEQNKDQNEL